MSRRDMHQAALCAAAQSALHLALALAKRCDHIGRSEVADVALEIADACDRLAYDKPVSVELDLPDAIERLGGWLREVAR